MGSQVHVEVTPRGSRIREPAPKAMQHLCAADLVPPEELLRRLRLQVTPAPTCVHRTAAAVLCTFESSVSNREQSPFRPVTC